MIGVMISLCSIYLGFMYGYDVPDCGKGKVTSENCNFAAYLDTKILTHAHMYTNTYDPEGFFTTLPSICNCYFGLIFTLIMKKHKEKVGDLV
jgi:predicted acyltransferase